METVQPESAFQHNPQGSSDIDSGFASLGNIAFSRHNMKMISPNCPSSPPIVRSVAMSANIASTVREEVKHLIRVNSIPILPSELERTSSKQSVCSSDLSDTYSSDQDYPSTGMPSRSSCSHVLPVGDDSIVRAVVLSRWDDIMGPRTIRVWLPETLSESTEDIITEEPAVFTTPRSVKAACQFTCSHRMAGGHNSAILMKAIKYVTSHTVNYTCVTGAATPEHGSSAIFIVPDLEMVAQSLMFHVPLSGSSPHSLALLIDYNCYDHYLSLRSLCQQWLERLTRRLAEFLLSVAGLDGIDGDECPPSTMVDNWLLEMCSMLHSLRVSGLGKLSALQNNLVSVTLGLPLLERALTSHLQTAGSTIVMGSNSNDINSVISFLALFLDEEARCCSRLVRPGQRDPFNMGLYLQGLLLDEFGCRELSAEELSDNPLPVTWIDLSRSSGPANAVRQGLPLHQHQMRESQAQSVMRVVKDESGLVRSLLHDLRQLAPHDWAANVTIFMERLHKLALTLLSIIHWNGVPPAAGRSYVNLENPTVRHLCVTLHIDHPTFLIVLAHAERCKPGAYRLVMEGSRA